MGAKQTIVLKGNFVRKEGEASGAITPGHLIEFGGANDIDVHGVAAGLARKAFALENSLIGGAISDAYSTGETVQYGVFNSGAEVYALLAYGETVTKGQGLVSGGDGTLALVGTSEDDVVVAFANEAKTNTTGGAAVRIEVEVR